MLILSLVFVPRLPEGRPPRPYPLCLDGDSRELLRASGFDDAPEPFLNRPKERRDIRRRSSLGPAD